MTAEAALGCLQRGDPTAALTLLDADADAAIRGMVLLACQRPEEARDALRTAIAQGDVTPATRLNLALAEWRTGARETALQRMHAVASDHPDWDEPRLRIAEAEREGGHTEAAERAYQSVLTLNHNRIEALLGLAGLKLLRGDAENACELLLRCCGVAPDRADAWDALGLALMQTGDTALAGSAFAEAQRLAPGMLDYALHRVEAASAAGEQSSLLAWLELEIDQDPLNPVLPTAMGLLLERLGRRAQAIDALMAAASLAPDAPVPAMLLGGVLARSHRLQEAEAALRRAVLLDPDNPQVANDHAAVLMRMHRHAEARATLLSIVDRHGEQVNVLCNLANATACVGLQDQAVALARRAITLAPDAVLPRRALCNTLPYRDGVTGAELLAALRACSDRLPHPAPRPFPNTPDPERTLVLGLLSGTLKTHPVGWLTIAGFETLHPDEFRIVCLAQNATHDPIGRRFRAVAQEWHDVDTLGDAELAERTRALGIDILIDLGGYGDAARLPACTHRLAPVQVKWVGMQTHSTGLPEMDWIITDRWETPPELEHVYSERPLRLADGYVCYSPPTYAPEVGPLPALANGHVTFGCFNNLAKITPHVIATWCRILQRIPNARLALKTHQFSDAATCDRLRSQFAAGGVAPERIELRGSSVHRTFLAEYNHIDIVLDPFPYSGGLTTCEALWMGVPTIAMPGETFSSRHSVSHLSNAGLSDWVAPDLDAYVAMAVRRAGDVAALSTLRTSLRAQVKASPVCDAPRFGRSLAAALRFAWRDWCARESAPR